MGRTHLHKYNAPKHNFWEYCWYFSDHAKCERKHDRQKNVTYYNTTHRFLIYKKAFVAAVVAVEQGDSGQGETLLPGFWVWKCDRLKKTIEWYRPLRAMPFNQAATKQGATCRDRGGGEGGGGLGPILVAHLI